MAVRRNQWKPPFEEFPSWLCPRCQSGTLSLDKNTFKFSETGSSEKSKEHEVWEPEWIDERFSGLLVCQDATCGEIVAIAGRTHHIEDHDFDLQQEHWVREFEPIYMHPAPSIFPIADKCPETVADELRKAFALFWSDTGACANRLRAAAEALLTDKNVPRTTLNKKRKREVISLHRRIEKFKNINMDAADYLLAIKWLGNAGSDAHLDALEGNDLLNGFELFEHVIELLYVQRERHLKKIAKSITSRKGRPTKRRKSFSW